jgi:phosphate-selective porin OprO/OprP
VALAASAGMQPALLPSFKTSAQQTFFAFDRTAAGSGTRHRFSPQYFYYYKSISSFGEYVRSTGPVTRGLVSGDLANQAFMITGAVAVTGETASERGVTPRNPFDPRRHGWGAFQIAARYHTVRITPAVLALEQAVPGANQRVRAFTIGANWYLNPYVKWVLDFERSVFSNGRDAARRPENAVLLRNQVSF